MEYYCSARKCNTAFFKAFQREPKADCSAVFTKMKDCIGDLIKFCWKDRLTESQIKGIVDASFKKEEYCGQNYMELPTLSPGSNLCTASYNNDSQNCMRSFRQKFIKDRSDPALCSEYAESKKCLKDLIYSDCNYPAGSKKLFNFTLGVYNPFCVDNRDPGATNNGHCYGVLDDDSATTGATGTTGTTLSDYDPLCMDNRDPVATKNSQCHGGLDGSSAAGTKPSVFQTLMFAFFLFFFLH